MKLLFLGTSGYHPTDRRQTTCLLLPECGIAFDAGTGIFRLGRYLQTEELDIFLTHAHLDHSAGLTYLFSILSEHPLKRVAIHGEAEKLQGIQEHLFSQTLFPVRPPWQFCSLSPNGPSTSQEPCDSENILLPKEGRLSWFSLDHPGGSIGYRVDWPDRSMAFVTDTVADPEADYVKKIEGVDLLIHECYYPDDRADLAKKFGHSSLSTVAETAKAAGVGRLYLTHIDPRHTSGENLDLASARRIFPKISLAEDLLEVVF